MKELLIVEKDRCTGCFACVDVCPNSAILMQLNAEGFYYPCYSEEDCQNCDLCVNNCPVNKREVLKEYKGREGDIEVYGGWSLSDENRLKSSSGGIFTEIAEEFIDQGHFVVGASWDSKWNLHHISIDKKDKLENLRGSKYIQSSLAGIYNEVNMSLLKGYNVLFSGTPCQVAALNLFVESKRNLTTIDLICHGVASTLVFEKYIEHVSHNKEVNNISFRDKTTGWSNFSFRVDYKNAQVFISPHKNDLFFQGYLKNIYLRPSCYDCPFCEIPRVSDITLGDFWGAPSDIFDDKGVSVILTNTNKGSSWINNIYKKHRLWMKRTDLDSVTSKNPRLVCGKLSIPQARSDFFHALQCSNFDCLKKKYLEVSLTKRLLRKVKSRLSKIKRYVRLKNPLT